MGKQRRGQGNMLAVGAALAAGRADGHLVPPRNRRFRQRFQTYGINTVVIGNQNVQEKASFTAKSPPHYTGKHRRAQA